MTHPENLESRHDENNKEPRNQNGVDRKETTYPCGTFVSLFFWTILLTALAIILVHLITIQAPENPEPVRDGAYFTVAGRDYTYQDLGLFGVTTFWSGMFVSIAATIQLLCFLYYAWKIVQDDESTTVSPGIAIWLLLLPFINFFWAFLVIPLLVRDLDRYCRRRRIDVPRIGNRFVFVFCFFEFLLAVPALFFGDFRTPVVLPETFYGKTGMGIAMGCVIINIFIIASLTWTAEAILRYKASQAIEGYK